MTPPPFELLTTFVTVAESRNFQEAAKKLGISQAAVSFQLKRLEAQVAFPLFALQGKKKVLTFYGRDLFTTARPAIDRFHHEIENLNRRFVSAEQLKLRIGCRKEIFEALAPSLVFPGSIQHFALSSHEAALELRDFKLDIAISHERPDSAELISKKVLESASTFVVHRKFLRKSVSFEEQIRDREFLTRVPAIFYQSDGHLLGDWLRKLDLSVEELRPALIAQDWRILQDAVDQGRGYAIVPDFIQARKPEITRIALPSSILPKFTFYALFRKDLRSIPSVRAMLDRLTT
jgi:DNA-binding transcriptional LysR family regulator